jgi:hypothetical protein
MPFGAMVPVPLLTIIAGLVSSTFSRLSASIDDLQGDLKSATPAAVAMSHTQQSQRVAQHSPGRSQPSQASTSFMIRNPPPVAPQRCRIHGRPLIAMRVSSQLVSQL